MTEAFLSQHLPTGYSVRPTRYEDAQVATDLWQQMDAEVGIQSEYSTEITLTEWKSPTHDFANHSISIEDAHGQMIASVNLWRFNNPPLRMWLSWTLHAEHRNKGIEEFIFEWGKARASEQLANCPPDVQVVLHSSANIKHAYRNGVFVAQGWQDVRHFYFMRIDMSEQPPAPVFPNGFTIRGMDYPQEMAESLRVDIDAFRDHWGFVESDFDEELTGIKYELDHNPIFDPSLYLVIVDDSTAKIVGNMWLLKEYDGHPEWGYVDGVAVLREYRGKGLAENGLRHAFHVLYAHGKSTVTLWVDADSLTGALRLYEKVGMHVQEETVRYEWVMRQGVDQMTRTLAH
jgi:mycothiol synthase